MEWKRRIKTLRDDTLALYFACRHPLTPWYARILAACVVAYLFSPIDLIPDPIPILGQLDDLILIPLGIVMVRALIPDSVFAECRDKAKAAIVRAPFTRWIVAALVITIWTTTAWIVGWVVWRAV